MKKLFFIFSFLLITMSALPAKADEGGSIIDLFSIASAGCGASGLGGLVGGAGGFGGTGGSSTSNCSTGGDTGLFASIACNVMKTFNAGVIPTYCKIVSHPDYLAAINAAVSLYVVFIGFSFLIGTMPMRLGPILGRVLKLSIVYVFMTNSDIYFNLVYNVVLQTPQDAVKLMIQSAAFNLDGATGGSQSFFEYVDKGVSKLIGEFVQTKNSRDGSGMTYDQNSLKVFVLFAAISEFGGDLAGNLFAGVIVGWLFSYISIMLRFLLAMLSLTFLLMLGPIFIPLILFPEKNPIRQLATEWTNMMISFMIQIVIVVAFSLMMQNFFIEFYNTIKGSLEQSAPQTSSQKHLVPFGDNTYSVEERKGEMTPDDANKYSSQALGGDMKQKLPELMFKLVVMFIILILSFEFMKFVPVMAVLLGGSGRFIRLFASGNIGGKETEALFVGQKGKSGSGPLADTFAEIMGR